MKHIAQACVLSDLSIVALTKRNIGALTESIDKTPYKLLLYGPTDFFAGPFLICGDGGEDLISLTDSQITKYEKKHHSPLIFLELYPKPITLKCTPELYAKCMGEEHQHDTQENERDER